MQSPNTARTNGRAPSAPRHTNQRSELDRLRATCRSQALTIDGLGEAVSTLRRGAAALKAENADLRAEQQRRSGHRGRARASGRPDGAAVAVRLACDVRAPAAARSVVAQCLSERVAAGVLEQRAAGRLRAGHQRRAPQRRVRHGRPGRARRTFAHDGSTRSRGSRARRRDRPAFPGFDDRRRLRPAARAGTQRALGHGTRHRGRHQRLGAAAAHAAPPRRPPPTSPASGPSPDCL